jgi:hypothetical protein
MVEHRVLRKIFGPRRKEVTDDRKLHNASIIIYNLKEILLG